MVVLLINCVTISSVCVTISSLILQCSEEDKLKRSSQTLILVTAMALELVFVGIMIGMLGVRMAVDKAQDRMVELAKNEKTEAIVESVMSYAIDFVARSKRTGEVVESVLSHLMAYFKGKAADAVTSTVAGIGRGAMVVGSAVTSTVAGIGRGAMAICAHIMFWKKTNKEDEVNDNEDEEERRDRERQFY